MDRIIGELRYAWRSLLRYRGLSIVAVACMALGIGASVTLFSAINPWLYRPLPYPEADRLVGLRGFEPLREGGSGGFGLVSGPDYLDLAERTRSFESIGAFDRTGLNLATEEEPERVHAARITAGLFPTLRVAPRLGRGITPAEDLAGAGKVALLGHGLWRRRFGEDPGVLGRTVTLDGTPHTVVGIMPDGFAFPEYAEVWTPLGLEKKEEERARRGLEVVARLRPGVTVAEAHAETRAHGAALEREHADSNRGWGTELRPLLAWLTPPGVVVGLKLLLAAGLFVQLIACANVGNVLLAKAAAQRHEVAMRLALGAGRGRLLRQFLAETVLLTGAGAALGVVLSMWAVPRLVADTPMRPPFWVVTDLDARGLAFVVAVTVASAFLVGLLPALQAGRVEVLDGLKEGARSVAGGPRGRLGRILVVSELALALVLLVGAGLMVQSFARRYAVDPGFDTRRALTARLALSGEAYADPERRASFLEELVRRLRTLDGVEEAGVASGLPFSDPLSGGWWSRDFEVEGSPTIRERAPRASYTVATTGYLQALGTRLRAGRLFSPEEEAEGRAVVVVSQDLADTHWGGDAVGRRLRLGDGPWLHVVGVVEQTREGGDMLLAGAKPAGQVYVPYRRDAWRTVSIVLRTRSDPAGLAGPLRAALRGLDPGLPPSAVFRLDEVRGRASWVARMWGRMLSQVAALALLLAALGVYGVVSHMVSQRTHEIGIRMAVGAGHGAVRWLVVREGMALALRATAVGLLGAFALTRLMAGLLYGVAPHDPSTFAACAALLLGVAFAASYGPARRATRVDPIEALRVE